MTNYSKRLDSLKKELKDDYKKQRNVLIDCIFVDYKLYIESACKKKDPTLKDIMGLKEFNLNQVFYKSYSAYMLLSAFEEIIRDEFPKHVDDFDIIERLYSGFYEPKED